MKRCGSCEQELPFAAFQRRPSSPDGLYNQCRSCRQTQAQARGRVYSPEQLAKNAERVRLRRAANPSAHRESSARWKQNHPEAHRAHQLRFHATRRAREVGSVSSSDLAQVMEEFNGGCAYCPAPATEWDHYVPLAQGGAHIIDNLVPACRRCNRSKWQRLPVFEWVAA